MQPNQCDSIISNNTRVGRDSPPPAARQLGLKAAFTACLAKQPSCCRPHVRYSSPRGSPCRAREACQERTKAEPALPPPPSMVTRTNATQYIRNEFQRPKVCSTWYSLEDGMVAKPRVRQLQDLDSGSSTCNQPEMAPLATMLIAEAEKRKDTAAFRTKVTQAMRQAAQRPRLNMRWITIEDGVLMTKPRVRLLQELDSGNGEQAKPTTAARRSKPLRRSATLSPRRLYKQASGVAAAVKRAVSQSSSRSRLSSAPLVPPVVTDFGLGEKTTPPQALPPPPPQQQQQSPARQREQGDVMSFSALKAQRAVLRMVLAMTEPVSAKSYSNLAGLLMTTKTDEVPSKHHRRHRRLNRGFRNRLARHVINDNAAMERLPDRDGQLQAGKACHPLSQLNPPTSMVRA